MNNVDKIMQYIQPVQKKPTVINDTTYEMKAKRIQLGSHFFQKDYCLSCGSCDVAEANVYTTYEFDKIQEYFYFWNHERQETCKFFQISEDECPLLNLDEYRQFIQDCKPEVVSINGQEVTIYVHPLRKQKVKLAVKDKETEQCTWTNELRSKPGTFVCKIHPVVSITCVMPHMTMRTSQSGTCRINTMQFGRNWAMKCAVCFRDPISEEDFEEIKAYKINKLNHLLHCAESLKIDTYLRDIIKYVEAVPYTNYEEYLEKDIIVIDNERGNKLSNKLKAALQQGG